jgi:hypothetical protein
MKFLCIYKPAKKEGTSPTQQEIERLEKLLAEWGKEGGLLAADGCLPSSLGARVRQTNGKVSVTDGPFTESRELVGSFAIVSHQNQRRGDRADQDFPKPRGRWRIGNTASLR